jgi:hypothetical protein
VCGRGEGVEGLAPAGMYWSAHGGPDGSIECCDGSSVLPGDLDGAAVSSSLRLVVFGACYVGSKAATWRKALGGRPLVVGWGRPVTIDRAVDFLDPHDDTETDLDDLLRRYLLADTPLPGEAANAASPMEAASLSGRPGDLPERVRHVAEMLGARWREREHWVDIDVPLPEGRRHVVRVFVVDGALPFSEGEPLLGIEGEAGELTGVADPGRVLSQIAAPGYARPALVRSDTEVPRLVVQGFLPFVRVRDTDLASLAYQVASGADAMEAYLFGCDRL